MNLLKNGGFESWDSPTQPSDWIISFTNAGSASKESSDIKEGSFALKITGSDQGTSIYQDYVANDLPGKTLKLKGWIKANTTSGEILISAMDSGGNYIGSSAAAQLSSGNVWTLLEAGKVLPAGTVKVRIACVCMSGVVDAIFDDIILEFVSSWVEVRPDGNNARAWHCVDSDLDGSNLIAVVNDPVTNGKVWTSSDFGASWTERQPAGATVKAWRACASNDDGSVLLVAAYGGRLYRSTDSGANWTEMQPDGNADRNWSCVDVDSDGSFLMASQVLAGGKVFISSDGGANWSEVQPTGGASGAWISCRCDSTGTNLIATNAARVYTSSNGGSSWTKRDPIDDNNYDWNALSISSDGSKIIAARYYAGHPFYVSHDGGSTWTEVDPPFETDGIYNSVDCSDDGLVCLMANQQYHLWTSIDGGITWVTEIVPTASHRPWTGASVSGDGSFMIAGGSSDRLYVSDVLNTQSEIKNISGVDQADVTTVSGVSSSDIKKVSGVK